MRKMAGPFKFGRNDPPEPDRLIVVEGCDWSRFVCEGKYVLYKNKRHGRFMRRDGDGRFEVDRETWGNLLSWEYVDSHEDNDAKP